MILSFSHFPMAATMAQPPKRTPTAAAAAAAAAATASVVDPTTTTTATTRGRRRPDESWCAGSFAMLPACRGLMIALGSSVVRPPPRHRGGSDDGNDGNDEEDDLDDIDDDDDRLYLYPQEDADLPEMHPNVRVPLAMLDRPDLLVRYGGGGEERREERGGECVGMMGGEEVMMTPDEKKGWT